MALQVEGQEGQSFAASFELRGHEGAGDLVLLTPLGNTLAQLEWRAGNARLSAGGKITESHSLDTLLQRMTGTQIPIAALFQWLKGLPFPADGWQADLSAVADGRLVARRENPLPQATLRIALTR